MGYTKTTWTSGTQITSSLLNHLESQYAAAVSDVDNHNHDSRYYLESEMDSGFWHAGNDGSGSGCDADTLEGHEASEFAGVGAPSGYIVGFDGASIPDGWVLCDGNNGTPDLRDKFIVGAGSSYSPGNTGGGASVTPTATVTIAGHALTVDELPAHTHSYIDKYADVRSISNQDHDTSVKTDPASHTSYTDYTGGDDPHGHPGSTFAGSAQENRPPYYALKFIMKT